MFRKFVATLGLVVFVYMFILGVIDLTSSRSVGYVCDNVTDFTNLEGLGLMALGMILGLFVVMD